MTASAIKPNPPRPKSEALPPFLPVLAAGLLFSGLIVCSDLDMRIARWAYAGSGAWRYETSIWVLLSFSRGTWPSLIAGILGAVVWLISQFAKSFRPYARVAGFSALLLAIGPGLIVNVVFKNHFGRPRPLEMTEFGGTRTFLPVLKLNWGEKGRSFPSGHAAMGFFWLGFFVLNYARNRRLAWAFLALGLIQGGLMGLARILQGSHWFSDVLWSALFVYLVAWILCCSPRLLPAR